MTVEKNLESSRIDNHKLILHPKRTADWLDKGDCYPIYVEVGLTNRCNHRCGFCALDYLEHGGFDMNTGIMLKTIEDISSHGVKSIMFAGEGEPLLHKDISKIIETSKKNNLDVSITTNGVYFNKQKADEILKHLSWIRFSVDAGTKETYSKIHGTRESDFEKLMDNIRYCSKLKKEGGYNVTIGTQFLLIAPNLDEIFSATELLKKAGADNIQIKPYSHHPDSKNDYKLDYKRVKGLKEKLEILSDEKFEVIYRADTMNRVSDKRCYEECYGLPFFALIDARGNVMPCNMFYNNEEFTYGNLNNNSFSEIWEGDKRKKVIKKIKYKGIADCRNACRLDPINNYLHRLKNPEPHDNFI